MTDEQASSRRAANTCISKRTGMKGDAQIGSPIMPHRLISLVGNQLSCVTGLAVTFEIEHTLSGQPWAGRPRKISIEMHQKLVETDLRQHVDLIDILTLWL